MLSPQLLMYAEKFKYRLGVQPVLKKIYATSKKIPPAEERAILIEMNLGEEDLNPSEKVFGWNYFARLSITSGMIENPVNAIFGSALTACQLRYVVCMEVDDTLPALQNHLHAHGFNYIEIRCDDQVRFTAACQDVDNICIKRVLTFVLKKYWATCASIAQPCRLSDKGLFYRYLGSGNYLDSAYLSTILTACANQTYA